MMHIYILCAQIFTTELGAVVHKSSDHLRWIYKWSMQGEGFRLSSDHVCLPIVTRTTSFCQQLQITSILSKYTWFLADRHACLVASYSRCFGALLTSDGVTHFGCQILKPRLRGIVYLQMHGGHIGRMSLLETNLEQQRCLLTMHLIIWLFLFQYI